jgi:hypothetical protein
MKKNKTTFIWALSLLAVLLIQFVATSRLGEPGYPGVDPKYNLFNPYEYFGLFKPHMVAIYTFVILGIIRLVDLLLSKKYPSQMSKYLPFLLVASYIVMLFFFISSDRIYQDPDFRVGLVYIDPFQVFMIPFYVAILFIFSPVFLAVTGLRFWKTNN